MHNIVKGIIFWGDRQRPEQAKGSECQRTGVALSMSVSASRQAKHRISRTSARRIESDARWGRTRCFRDRTRGFRNKRFSAAMALWDRRLDPESRTRSTPSAATTRHIRMNGSPYCLNARTPSLQAGIHRTVLDSRIRRGRLLVQKGWQTEFFRMRFSRDAASSACSSMFMSPIRSGGICRWTRPMTGLCWAGTGALR